MIACDTNDNYTEDTIMGLTIHYQLQSASRSPAKARQLVEQVRQKALDLPFKEVGEIVEVNTADARKRAAFAERQAKSQEQLARLFRRAGIDAMQLRTDEPYGATLGKFFEKREKRRLRG